MGGEQESMWSSHRILAEHLSNDKVFETNKIETTIVKELYAVKDRVDDKLMTARLSFSSFVASLVEPFFKKYQCDKPMIPFIYTDLKSMIQICSN